MRQTPIPDIERKSFLEKTTTAYRRVVSETNNSLGSIRTNITTTPTFINVPDNAEQIYIKHVDTGAIIWIGDNNLITPGGADTFPISPGETMSFRVKKGNSNNIYGVVSSESAYIYVLGAFDA